jgi:hypothetical protein
VTDSARSYVWDIQFRNLNGCDFGNLSVRASGIRTHTDPPMMVLVQEQFHGDLDPEMVWCAPLDSVLYVKRTPPS